MENELVLVPKADINGRFAGLLIPLLFSVQVLCYNSSTHFYSSCSTKINKMMPFLLFRIFFFAKPKPQEILK